MRLNLTIAQIGLILVGGPLACEVAFLATLYAALEKAEAVARTESQSRAVVAEAHGLAHTLYEAGYVEVKWRFAWRFAKDQSMLKEFDGIIASIPAQFQKLKQLTAGNERQQAHVERIGKPLKEVVRLLTFFRQNVGADNTIPIDRALWAKQLAKSIKELLTEVRALAQEEEQVEDTYASATALSNKRVKQVLLAGVLLNVLVAISLSILFYRTFTKRLAILADNALLLSTRQPLNKPIGGSDEVFQLDKVFHQMADVLKEAEQRKQDFVAMLGHDLRTPLSSVRGTLALIARGVYGALDDKGQRRVLNAETSLDHLIGLVNELLLIEKIEAGMLNLAVDRVHLSSLVEQVMGSLSTFAEQHDVSVVPPSKDIEVMADADKLDRVLTNLVSNAIKYSPAGSQVAITASESADWSEVQVVDHGRGIPQDAIAGIFDRFRQVDRSDEVDQGGSGLGLAICKAIIEAHKGEIGVDSEVGKGSTFWFRLPRRPAA